MKIVIFQMPSLRQTFVFATLIWCFVLPITPIQAQTGEGKDPLTERAQPRQKPKTSSTTSQSRQGGVSKAVARTPVRRGKAASSRTTPPAASNQNQDETGNSETVPQRVAPPPNTVVNEGRLRPANGYRWVNPNDPNEFRVELLPGLIKVGTGFVPDKGYDWINPDDPDDFRVELVPDAEITSISYQHNVAGEGKYGLLINVNFKTYNLRSSNCVALALFYFASGQKLKDFNDNFVIDEDHVATFEKFEPTYDASRYENFKLFIPYSELHVKSGETHWLTFNLHIAMEDGDGDGLIRLATSTGNKFDVCIGCK